MNYGILFFLLSRITLVISLGFLASLGVGFIYREDPNEILAIQGLALSMVLGFGFSAFLNFIGERPGAKLLRKEAFCLIGVGWIVAILMASLPYSLGLRNLSLVDALFEAASGLTTTGSSIFASLEGLPHSLLFWRSLTQWIGGLGVVVFFVAILSSLGVGAKALFSGEASAHSSDVDYSRVQSGVIRILILYLLLSICCYFLLNATDMPNFEALCTMFSTVSTGGFSCSAMPFSGSQQWIMVIFMIIGGTSFLNLLRFFKRGLKEVLFEAETLAYYSILLIGMLVIWLLIHDGYSDYKEGIRVAAFQVTSILTTSGFAVADYSSWIPGAQCILFLLMCIGGSSGSTSGGIKVVRFLMALRLSVYHIESTFRSNVIRLVQINTKTLDRRSQDDMLFYLLLTAIMIGAGTLFVSMMEPNIALQSSFSAVWSHIFNIGPGFYEVGPMSHYGLMSDSTKLFLLGLMVMGRLEFYAVLVLFSTSLWKNFS